MLLTDQPNADAPMAVAMADWPTAVLESPSRQRRHTERHRLVAGGDRAAAHGDAL